MEALYFFVCARVFCVLRRRRGKRGVRVNLVGGGALRVCVSEREIEGHPTNAVIL